MTGYRADYLLSPPPTPRFTVPDDGIGDQRWVYLHIGPERDCLYVGMTRIPAGRTRQHEAASGWFADIAEIIWFGTMSELNAASVEREFITALQPANNIRHTEREFFRLAPDEQVKRCETRIAQARNDLRIAEVALVRAQARQTEETA